MPEITYDDEAASLSALADRLEELFKELTGSPFSLVQSASNDVDAARRSLRQAVEKLDKHDDF